jgi:histidinol-phosphate aminotransferase
VRPLATAGRAGVGVVTIEFAAKMRRIPIYPQAETYEFGGELVKLASNETPFAPHPDVIAVAEHQLRTLNRYPDPDKSLLRRRLADRFDVAPGRVAVGNGSCEILLAAAEALLEPGAEVVYAWPSFSMYPHLAASSGARAVEVPLDATGRHDLDAMAAEVNVATRLVLVCNPNNPTATAIPIADVDAFVASLPRHVCVILDEAYVEFSTLQDPDESLPVLDRHPNLVLLRTFSKVYGLCGLRVGYSLGPEDFRLAVDRVRQPFSVNAVAQAAAAEALRHQDEVASRVERTAIERLYVEEELAERGIETTDSEANFSWVSLGDRDEPAVLKGLADQGVIVRGGGALGSSGHLRVTYGTRLENERFLRALDEVLAQAPAA